ncbi:MAG: hypothetical protein C0167_02820, partial [Nitrososphaera sp.]
DAASRLWNELSYERRQEYFEARRRGMSQWASLKHVDLRGTRKKHVPKYAEVLFYFEGRIARLESEAAHAKAGGDEVKYYKLWAEVRRLKRKWTARRLHLYRNLASHLIHELWERGVSTIYVGYPHEIAQERGNKYSVNIWAYRELVERIEAKAREYGISVYEVFERGTSSHCAYHGAKVSRNPRGVVTCPVGDHRLHSDLNGALNMLRRGSGVLVQGKGNLKPLSFIVDHNGVVPTPTNQDRNSIAPTKGDARHISNLVKSWERGYIELGPAVPTLLVGLSLASVVVAFAISAAIAWYLSMILPKIGRTVPDVMKGNRPVAHPGGPAIFAGMAVGLAVLWMATYDVRILAMLAVISITFAVGIVDDLKVLPGPVKVLGTIVAALTILLMGA